MPRSSSTTPPTSGRCPLDALATLRAAEPFAPGDVERMEVTFPQNWTAIMDDPSGATFAPASYSQATNNLRFCLALGLHEGRVYIDEFDERHLRDAAILDTARRVIPHPDAELGRIFETTDRAPTRLEVVLKSGARHTPRRRLPARLAEESRPRAPSSRPSSTRSRPACSAAISSRGSSPRSSPSSLSLDQHPHRPLHDHPLPSGERAG